MDIHSVTEYEPFDPMAFERQALNEKRGLIPQIEPRYRYPISAISSTAATRQATISIPGPRCSTKDTFEAFRESGDLFNKKIAADFRAKLLSRGGSEDGMSLYPGIPRRRPRQAGDVAQPRTLGRTRARNPPTKAKRSFSRKYGRNSPHP